jgi:ribosomal protein L11 methyltransferase
MKKLYCFNIKDDYSIEQAWEELELHGAEMAYSEEDEHVRHIFGYWETDLPIPSTSSVADVLPATLPSIDWNAQWAAHGLDFRDGYVHVNLALFGGAESLLRLEPGPGFGDLSHPTTRLILRLMAKYLNYSLVVDVGCGSGILTLAAVVMGAPVAYGIDIDPQALEHAYTNAKVNHLEKQCHFYLPTDFTLDTAQPIVIVMNMILSEQIEAWNELAPQLQDCYGLCLTSGVRKEERALYLDQAAQWGWQYLVEIEEGDWVGFAFERPYRE